MKRLLYIKASPRREGSKSAEIAEAFLGSFRRDVADLQVDLLDLALDQLPEFDGDKVAAQMNVITGQIQTAQQRTAWDEITAMATRFSSADIYVLAVPMWNGGIPYKLKQYIDIIHQPGLLWQFDPEAGYSGLLKGKRAFLVLTSGVFSPDVRSSAFGTDHHSTYLRAWLNQAGVTDIVELRFQPTLLTSDPKVDFESAKLAAREAARVAASHFMVQRK